MTKKIFSDTHALVAEMVQADKGRNQLFMQQENMFNGKWNFPAEIADIDWMRKVVSTDPHDQVRTGTRVLSSLDPAFRFQPYDENPESKQKANEYETMLKYLFLKAGQRTQGNIIADYVFSSLMFDMVAAYIDFIPKSRLTGKRKTMAEKYGPFIVTLKNPKDIHFRYSEAGLEQVAQVGNLRVKDIISYWGDKAVKLAEKYKDPEDQNEELVYVDYWDLDKRLTWCEERDMNSVAYELDMDESLPDFWPWVIRAGGTKLTSSPEDQFLPLNAATAKTDQWEHDNLIQSLIVSEAIARAGKARTRKFGTATTVETDMMEPGGIESVSNPDPNSVQDVLPPPLDQSLVDIHNLFQGSMSKSGIARVLQSAESQANQTFATFNQQVQLALGTIKPYRELAEKALGDTAEIMCRWIANSPDAIEVIGNYKEDNGRSYIMVPEEINTERLCVTVELKPDVPTDRMERINAASLAKQQLNYSNESALEDIGVADPQKEVRRSYYERLLESKLNKILAMDQLEIERMKMEMEAGIRAQLQQQQMAQQAELQAQQQPQGVEGQGFNPAMGGTPPAEAQPTMTREQISGVTQGGAGVGTA